MLNSHLLTFYKWSLHTKHDLFHTGHHAAKEGRNLGPDRLTWVATKRGDPEAKVSIIWSFVALCSPINQTLLTCNTISCPQCYVISSLPVRASLQKTLLLIISNIYWSNYFCFPHRDPHGFEFLNTRAWDIPAWKSMRFLGQRVAYTIYYCSYDWTTEWQQLQAIKTLYLILRPANKNPTPSNNPKPSPFPISFSLRKDTLCRACLALVGRCQYFLQTPSDFQMNQMPLENLWGFPSHE